MERRPSYLSHAGLLRCLALLSMAAVLLYPSMSRANEPALDEAAASDPFVSELFSEPTTVEPDDVPPAPVEAPAGEPAQPPPAVEPAALPESSVPTPQALWQDRPITSLKATLHYTKGDLPPNKAAPQMAEAALMGNTFGDIRPWVLSNYEWEAPATRHLPLLFEEPNLERMGYSPLDLRDHREDRPRHWMTEQMQPLVSGAHFAGNLVMIPYRSGYQPITEPVYTLGVDRPGSPVSYREHQMPLSLRGGLHQAGFFTGLIFLIP